MVIYLLKLQKMGGKIKKKISWKGPRVLNVKNLLFLKISLLLTSFFTYSKNIMYFNGENMRVSTLTVCKRGTSQQGPTFVLIKLKPKLIN